MRCLYIHSSVKWQGYPIVHVSHFEEQSLYTCDAFDFELLELSPFKRNKTWYLVINKYLNIQFIPAEVKKYTLLDLEVDK